MKISHLRSHSSSSNSERLVGEFMGKWWIIISYLDILQSKWLNSNKLNVTDQELLEAYFSLLTDAEIEKLYQIYLLDFQQFGYSFQFRGINYN